MKLVPVSRERARTFVGAWHGHSRAPWVDMFRVGLESEGLLIGVGVAGRPVATGLCDGRTVEITRLCLAERGHRNAASKLYGALCRAAGALGYSRVVTYTLGTEEAVSVRAAGFRETGRAKARSWDHSSRRRELPDLFDTARVSASQMGVERVRWERNVG